MANGKVILGRYGESGEAGWTRIVPSDAAQFYYVMPSHPSATDDPGNAGTDPTTPLATLSRAGALCGARSPRASNWVLAAETDTFTGDDQILNRSSGTNGFHLKGGLSWNEPFVLTSYNPNLVGLDSSNPRGTQRDAPPLLDVTNLVAGSQTQILNPNASQADHYAIIGLDFYCRNADPINNPGDYDDTRPYSGISISSAMGTAGATFLIEDVHCLAGMSIGLSSSDNNHSSIVRRSSVGYVQGNALFCKSAPYLLLEENSFIHGGWIGGAAGNTTQADRSNGGQNLYTNFDANRQQRRITRGNFSYEGSETGLRSRQGGEVYDNLCMLDNTGIEIGVNNLTYVPDKNSWCGSDYRVHDNVCLDDIGNGIWFPGTASNSGPAGCSIYRNLIAHCGVGISAPNIHTLGSGADTNVCINIGAPSRALEGGIEASGSVVTSTAGMSNPNYKLVDYATGHMGLADLAAFLTNKKNQRRYNFDQRYMPWYINNVIRGFYNMSTTIDNRPAYYAASTPIPGRFLKV
jgi:hypothetical protein